jgi:hypothetical protein
VLVQDGVAVAHAALVRNKPEQLGAQIDDDRHDRRLDGGIAG